MHGFARSVDMCLEFLTKSMNEVNHAYTETPEANGEFGSRVIHNLFTPGSSYTTKGRPNI